MDRVLTFLIIFAVFTAFPFAITYILKWNCKDQCAKGIANRFFSRKWMITMFPCVLIIILLGDDTIPEEERHWLLQWAIFISMTYVICDNIKTFISHFVSIKVKKGDLNVELQPSLDNKEIN